MNLQECSCWYKIEASARYSLDSERYGDDKIFEQILLPYAVFSRVQKDILVEMFCSFLVFTQQSLGCYHRKSKRSEHSGELYTMKSFHLLISKFLKMIPRMIRNVNGI